MDFTNEALVAKKDGVNAISPAMDANSNYALATALKQAGVKMKAAIYATGYEPDVIKSTAWKDLQGGYFLSLFRPWSLPNAGTEQMQAAMEKYAHFNKTDFPNFGQYEAWAGADLMIKGLQMAGPQPHPCRGDQGSAGASSPTTSTGSCRSVSTTRRTSGTTRPRPVPGS